MLSPKLRAICFNVEMTALKSFKPEFRLQEGQKERRELLPLETGDTCLSLLAVIDTAAIYQERTNIPPRQKNVCLHCTTNVESSASLFLKEWALQTRL